MVLGGAGCRGWSCGSGHKSIGHVCRAVLHDLLHAGASFKEVRGRGVWNRLNNHIVSAQTMGSFKRRLDRFMDEDDRWN